VDVLIRIALILFFSAIGWTLLPASLIENRLASDIHGRPLPSARPYAADAVSQRAGGGDQHHHGDDPALGIGVNIAPLLAGAGALGLAISFGAQTLVKDIITGIFIQFENGMNTGDLVTIGPLPARWNGCRFAPWACARIPAPTIIPWSSITTFANFVRGIGSVVANYDVDDMRIWIKPARR
jgi:hypothetical protein